MEKLLVKTEEMKRKPPIIQSARPIKMPNPFLRVLVDAFVLIFFSFQFHFRRAKAHLSHFPGGREAGWLIGVSQ